MCREELTLQGDFASVTRSIITALIGVLTFAVAIMNYLFYRTTLLQRILLVLTALSLNEGSWITDLGGIILLTLVIVLNLRTNKMHEIQNLQTGKAN